MQVIYISVFEAALDFSKRQCLKLIYVKDDDVFAKNRRDALHKYGHVCKARITCIDPP